MHVWVSSLPCPRRSAGWPAALAVAALLLAATSARPAQQKAPTEGGEKAAEIARGLRRDAEKHLKAGKTDEAVAAYRKALRVQEKLAADFPAVPGYRFDLAGCHLGLAGVLRQTGRLKEAEAGTRQAVALLERLVTDFPANGPYRRE